MTTGWTWSRCDLKLFTLRTSLPSNRFDFDICPVRGLIWTRCVFPSGHFPVTRMFPSRIFVSEIVVVWKEQDPIFSSRFFHLMALLSESSPKTLPFLVTMKISLWMLNWSRNIEWSEIRGSPFRDYQRVEIFLVHFLKDFPAYKLNRRYRSNLFS